MNFPVTIRTHKNTFINFRFISFKTSSVPLLTDCKVFFFWIKVMEFEGTDTFIIATNFTLTTLILNKKFFQFFPSSLHGFGCTLFTPTCTICPQSVFCKTVFFTFFHYDIVHSITFYYK